MGTTGALMEDGGPRWRRRKGSGEDRQERLQLHGVDASAADAHASLAQDALAPRLHQHVAAMGREGLELLVRRHELDALVAQRREPVHHALAEARGRHRHERLAGARALLLGAQEQLLETLRALAQVEQEMLDAPQVEVVAGREPAREVALELL